MSTTQIADNKSPNNTIINDSSRNLIKTDEQSRAMATDDQPQPELLIRDHNRLQHSLEMETFDNLPSDLPNVKTAQSDCLDIEKQDNNMPDDEGAKKKDSIAHRETSNHKYHFRAPQQFGHKKKKWNKQFKARQKSHQQQINKADMENIQNLKNQANYRKQQQQQQQQLQLQQQQHALKNSKQNFNSKNPHRINQFTVRSKFFLPEKRPRKEIIIPPTKFLLGGNISDPLNLNSLQDEALNATTPVPTPKQSPITTPPKIEVIIPPNINDPLHLLDPVDSVEYEKQLVSPMKRKSKTKHRHRKKKPKRKRLDNCDGSSVSIATVTSANNACNSVSVVSISIAAACSTLLTSKCTNITEPHNVGDVASSSVPITIGSDGDKSGDLSATCNTDDDDVIIASSGGGGNGGGGAPARRGTLSSVGSINTSSEGKRENEESAQKPTTSHHIHVGGRSIDREKVTKDLRLDLSFLGESNQLSSGAGRKRKISEGPNSAKIKFRRMDSMDKIVSPVVPQPGAWKRPPRTVPSGARKGSRVHSTSMSESDIISPTDETKTIESENIPENTPVPETVKLEDSHKQNENKDCEPHMPKFKPDDLKYQYGNYDRYSGYRNLNDLMDVRLKVFQRNAHLFREKDVLDIGCNVGHMTIAVAKNLGLKSIQGIDIDRTLIARARKNLSFYVRIPKCKRKRHNSGKHATNNDLTAGTDDQNNKHDDKSKRPLPSSRTTKTNSTATTTAPTTSIDTATNVNTSSTTMMMTTSVTATNKPQLKRNTSTKRRHHNRHRTERDKGEFFPISFPICYGEIKSIPPVPRTIKTESPAAQVIPKDVHLFPKNVFFRTANYVLKDESALNNDTQQYDVIMCLSVTKWIHLNFGDAGLKLAFKRMFNQLRPGGKLILEAQNWASYKKKKNLTQTIYNNYRNIEFFPNKFHEYLLGSEVGFSHSYPLGVPRHLNKGFCRPIQLYAKGDYTPNHIRWSDNYHPQTPSEAYRGIYAGTSRPPYPLWGYDTPYANSGTYSCRQTPLHPGPATSQYYNPLQTDSYLPSYETEVPNRHYCFASPLYQTVWSPPASLRNSASHTPVYGSVRESDPDDSTTTPGKSRHVYPPTECSSSPHNTPARTTTPFGSIREADIYDSSQQAQHPSHVYANCDSSSSPTVERTVESSLSVSAVIPLNNRNSVSIAEDQEPSSSVDDNCLHNGISPKIYASDSNN